MTAPHDPAGSSPSAAASQDAAAPAGVRRCPSCNQHFSGDARFCPFDGEPLQDDPRYRPDADPLIGILIGGRYEVEAVLGEGGMGTVYAVRHRSLGKRFALKVMRADMAQQGDLAARFIQEARAAAAIGHPNIVQITDFGELPSRAPYFVMELLDGTSLSKLIRAGGPLPSARAVRILQQVASALAAAHAAGVIHRDLKPDNIHIAPTDAVKVLDFGVAKMAGAGRLTRTGMVFGTPHYMSPEQASGGPVDHRADIYALGIIMYEMFTGRVPFEADSYMGVLTKHMFMVPEPPSRVHKAARELGALEDVTLRCLEKKPEARYPSMEALIGEVESIVRFAGDRLEILRPRSQAVEQRASVHLADELEPPAREEIAGMLRAAGIPAGLPMGRVLGGLAVAILLVGGAYAWVRPPKPAAWDPVGAAPSGAGPVSATLRGTPLAVPAGVSPRAPLPGAEPVPGSAAEDPIPGITTAAPASSKKEGAPPARSRQERAAPPRSGSGRAGTPPPPTSAPNYKTFGTGDLVNPWAK